MAQYTVHYIMQRLVNDTNFRDQFVKDRRGSVASLDLTPDELDALDKLDVDEFIRAAHSLRNTAKPLGVFQLIA